MNVHVIDGTYELFRHYFAVPSSKDVDGKEVGAIRGVLNSILRMIRDGATHIGVATDHVVESFSNEMWDGYKTGEGIEPELWDQFHPLEEALRAMGIVVWPMIEYATGSDAARSLSEVSVVYSYTTATWRDWQSSLLWGLELVQSGRPPDLRHETNYPLGPLLLFLFLVPWGRCRGLAVGMAASRRSTWWA